VCGASESTIYERTGATTIEPRIVTTDRGVVRADVLIRATEGYTAELDSAIATSSRCIR
jgi:glycine/D-amino acid oxidase-like deaminating enzyme